MFEFSISNCEWLETDGVVLRSNLSDKFDSIEYRSAIDGMESLLLGLVAKGIITNINHADVEQVVRDTVEHIANNTI